MEKKKFYELTPAELRQVTGGWEKRRHHRRRHHRRKKWD